MAADFDDYLETVREADIRAKTTGNPQAIIDRTGRLLVVPADRVQAGDRVLERVRGVAMV